MQGYEFWGEQIKKTIKNEDKVVKENQDIVGVLSVKNVAKYYVNKFSAT